MITCYGCNQEKPGDPAPFAICDDCKTGTEPTPETHKPFTELDPPKRNKELVMSVQWIQKVENSNCQQMMGNGKCLMPATWQCCICGQWTCDLHEHESQLQGYSVCEQCGKLSRFDQEHIMRFREEMNAL